jgi:hypothetical protein
VAILVSAHAKHAAVLAHFVRCGLPAREREVAVEQVLLEIIDMARKMIPKWGSRKGLRKFDFSMNEQLSHGIPSIDAAYEAMRRAGLTTVSLDALDQHMDHKITQRWPLCDGERPATA